MSPKKVSVLAALAIVATHLSCGSKPKRSNPPIAPTTDNAAADSGELLLALENAPPGLQIRISEGQLKSTRMARAKLAPATPLPADQVNALLARMPALKKLAGDVKAFALREDSKPPPRTGKTVKDVFPPPPSAVGPPSVDVEAKVLEVLRYAPEGEVPLAPNLSVTFNLPMVAVTSHADTIAAGVPVKLTPQPAGQWRWIGTKTLLFDPAVRFPAATAYKVSIAAGTRSASGASLAKPVEFSFGTPAPRLTAYHPTGGPHRLDPLMFARFDQKISAAAVLEKIRVKAGGHTYRPRLATADEIKADETIAAMVAAADKAEQKGRYLVFRVDGDLPKDTTIAVVFEKGTPSAEGPRTTGADQSFSFRTYGPLKVVRTYCSYGRRCPPRTPWSIQFTNPIDPDKFDAGTLAFSPELDGMRAQASGKWMSIQGRSKGRTNYTVTLPASLTDTFGQTLGKETRVYFNVGDANPALFGKSGLVVLDPAARRPTFDIHTVNIKSLDVEIYRVDPSDWDRFAAFMQKNPRVPRKPPGTRVVKTRIKPATDVDGMVETRIDLSKALSGGLGHAVVLVEPTTWPTRYKPWVHTWVQSTKIGLDAFVDSGELVAWATRLADGEPMSGASLEIAPAGRRATSAEDGLARIALPKSSPKGKRNLLIARKGNDTAFLPENTYFWSEHGGWVRRELGETLSWFVFSDRGMYKPTETVNIKGWIRSLDRGEGGDVGRVAGALDKVRYKVTGSRGNEITSGTTEITALGGFDLSFKLPKTPNLGNARIELRAEGRFSAAGAVHYHSFQIQEFRRPEYEVTAKASPGPHIVGKGADVTVTAKYYAGGGLANADTRWNVRSEPGNFVPPNRSEWTFGRWIPWWMYHRPDHQLIKNQQFTGKTDASGAHSIHLDFLSASPPRPMTVTASAHVTDVNRQSWAANATMLVHPSALYVGLKRERYFVEQGEPIEIESIVVDHDGNATTGVEVQLRAVRLDWAYKNGQWTEEEIDPQTCEVVSSSKPGNCEFKTPDGGTYRIVARVTDSAGRPNESEVMVWVSGGKRPPQREVELEKLTLIPNKKEYAPGDTAEILVQSPFYPAEGLMTLRRSGIVETTRFELKGPTATLEVPIRENQVPNVYVQFDVVGSATRLDDDGEANPKLPRRPAYASGALNLSIPPRTRTLKVAIKPAKREIEPGGKTTVAVRVTDHRGRPLRGAELAAIVVDEAVLALSGYKTPDPVAAFYAQRQPGARDYHARAYVKLARPDVQTMGQAQTGSTRNGRGDAGEVEMDAPAAEPAPMADKATAPPARAEKRKREASALGGAVAGRFSRQTSQPAIAVRKNFDALATFAPVVKTGADGRATVKVKVPDNLTRYRVMVVAVDRDKRFGSGESSITARMPLMVRPSPPRFLNFGDKFELPVVLQNQTDEVMSVRVAVRTTNAALTQGAGRLVSVPANDRVEVRFPSAAEMPGIARFQIGAQSGRWSDAAELSLPVWSPATTEAFATYGTIDKSGGAGAIKQAIAMPRGVVEEFGGLELTTSSTQLQALTDAFVYLVNYPFECSEQTASRIIAIAALRDVLGAFEAKGLPEPAEIERIIDRDIKRLRSMQNYDGGFAWWVRGRRSWPYNSIHAAHSLVRAKEKGYKVPADMLARSKRYLEQIERHIPWYYPLKVKRTLISYALYVRKRMGDRDTKKALGLIRTAGLPNLSMEAIGWLLGTLTGDRSAAGDLRKIHRYLDNKTTETAATAHWATSYSDGAHLILHSNRRADGIILEALIDDKPKSDLIPKVVRGLLAHRKRGRWSNTQENSFVLLAMDRYFREYEKVTPNFVARAWLGDRLAAEQRFRGRQTKRNHVDVPMSWLAKQGKSDLVIAKQGAGRLYYRIGMTYAPESLWLAPVDHGFAIERVYEPVDDPGDVVRKKDGTWRIKAGAQVRVRLTMAAEARRYHVALVDKLPAGLEPLNPALAVTGEIPVDPKQQKSNRYWWWHSTWYEHQNMRDERVEAFASLLWAGVHEYTYVARATTPGTFIVPPAKAEEMYFPETFGRSASAKVIIE